MITVMIVHGIQIQCSSAKVGNDGKFPSEERRGERCHLESGRGLSQHHLR